MFWFGACKKNSKAVEATRLVKQFDILTSSDFMNFIFNCKENK